MKRFFCFMILLNVLLSSGCLKEPEKKLTPAEVDSSINRGFSYLNTVFDENYGYDDMYLQFVYPGEDLQCPHDDCNLTYRIMDGYFNLIFIQNEFDDYSIIQEQAEYGDNVLTSVLPLWQEGYIYNVIKNTSEEGKEGYALDTLCILGYLYDDKILAEKAKDSLKDGRWLDLNHYVGIDSWRTLADESWCVRHIIRTGIDDELALQLAQDKIQETYDFIDGDYPEISKIVTVVHMLYIFVDLDEGDFETDSMDKDLAYFQQYIKKNLDNENLWENTLLLANVLDVLAKTEYDDEPTVSKIASEIFRRQESNGKWYQQHSGAKADYLQTFTTFRSVIGLNSYRRYMGWN